jgi:type II secretory pathway pseudopilin PulG
VGLFTIVVTIAVGGFTNAMRTQRQVASLISAQSNVSLALEEMSREIRTGYLFCHDVDSNAPSSNCANAANAALPTCSVDASSTAWTCPALDFYDAESNHVNYFWKDGTLMEKVNDGTAQSITGNTVSVKNLQFVLYGQTEGDNWTPRVTVSLGISPSSTDPAIANDVINLQTTVSARTIDCTPGSSPKC